jgi:hypothetical protein
MRNYFLLFYFLFVIALVSGCSTTLYTSTNEEISYDATEASNVTVTTNDYSDKDYSEIGFVTTTQTNLLAAKNELKKYAGKMGGDAILNFKVTVVRTYIYIIFIPIPIDNYVCRGTVIKYV